IEINRAIIPITTRSSTSVNALMRLNMKILRLRNDQPLPRAADRHRDRALYMGFNILAPIYFYSAKHLKSALRQAHRTRGPAGRKLRVTPPLKSPPGGARFCPTAPSTAQKSRPPEVPHTPRSPPTNTIVPPPPQLPD